MFLLGTGFKVYIPSFHLILLSGVFCIINCLYFVLLFTVLLLLLLLLFLLLLLLFPFHQFFYLFSNLHFVLHKIYPNFLTLVS